MRAEDSATISAVAAAGEVFRQYGGERVARDVIGRGGDLLDFYRSLQVKVGSDPLSLDRASGLSLTEADVREYSVSRMLLTQLQQRAAHDRPLPDPFDRNADALRQEIANDRRAASFETAAAGNRLPWSVMMRDYNAAQAPNGTTLGTSYTPDALRGYVPLAALGAQIIPLPPRTGGFKVPTVTGDLASVAFLGEIDAAVEGQPATGMVDLAPRRIGAFVEVSRLALVQGGRELDRILAVSDGIMVARGDLAVEVGNAAVPGLQKHMIKRARELDKLVITATQMMESMIVNPVPTRAEVSDVANAVLDGTDAVMLSAETAAGKYPLETVEMMAAVCLEAEKTDHDPLDDDFVGAHFNRIDHAIAMGALFTAHHLKAKAIVALTDSGSTPLWMSRHSVRMPIYALTPKVATQRKMALMRNVSPLLMDTSADRDTALTEAEAHLKKRGIVQSGDVYAITVGEPMGTPGGTNTLKICRAA